MPFAPGTFGSLPPVAIVVGLLAIGTKGTTITLILAVLMLAYCVICLAFSAWAEQHLGRKDPGTVVADEVAAQAMVFLYLPWRTGTGALDFYGDILHDPGFWNLSIVVVGFVLFRIFDISKPPPARALEKLHGGWGMLLDDLAAGVYAMIGVQVFARVILPGIV